MNTLLCLFHVNHLAYIWSRAISVSRRYLKSRSYRGCALPSLSGLHLPGFSQFSSFNHKCTSHVSTPAFQVTNLPVIATLCTTSRWIRGAATANSFFRLAPSILLGMKIFAPALLINQSAPLGGFLSCLLFWLGFRPLCLSRLVLGPSF